MNGLSQVQPVGRGKTDWGSIVQLAFCGLAFLAFFGLAAFLGISAITGQLNQTSSSANLSSSFSLSLSYLLIAGFLILSAGFAFLRILGEKEPTWLERARQAADRWLVWLILLWPLVLLAGDWAETNTVLSWILVPVLHLLAVCLPVIWLVHLGRRGLRKGSFQRSLGILSAGMAGSFFLAFVAEMLVIIVLFIGGLVILAGSPSTLLKLEFLVQRLSNANMDPEVILRALQPYLVNPVVIFCGLAFISGFVPIIEEFFKPLAIWLLGKKLITPADGFAAGLLAGGGFALTESLGQVGAGNGPEWLMVELGRGGTDLLHILTAGLMGWALVRAWRSGNAWAPALIYPGVILLHGLWNALTLGIGLAPFLSFSPSGLPHYSQIQVIAPAGLVVLCGVMLVVLLRMNRVLRTEEIERKQVN